MIRFFFAILVLCSATATFPGDNSSSCEYYIEQAEQLGCTPHNYLIRYGYHYCQKFKNTELNYSPHGQQVLRYIRACLISVMKTALNSSSVINSCDNAEQIGVSSHAYCYIASGFCEMSFNERLQVIATASPALFNFEFQSSGNEILKYCAKP